MYPCICYIIYIYIYTSLSLYIYIYIVSEVVQWLRLAISCPGQRSQPST